jgi:multidrug resistance efflux pump
MLETQIALPTHPRRGILVTRSLVANAVVLFLSMAMTYTAWQLLKTRMTTVVSRDAVINGTLININAPIDGTLSQMLDTTGKLIKSKQALAALDNPIVAAPPSQMPIQAVKTRIDELQTRLDQARLQLNQTLMLQQTWGEENAQQQQLETQEASGKITEVEAQLQTAKDRRTYAETFYQRQLRLYNAGAIAKASLDTAAEERDALDNQINTITAQITTAKTRAKASTLGLNLDRERNSYSPRLRLQDLKIQATTQQQEITAIEQRLQSAQAELAQLDHELKQTKTAIKRTEAQTITAPITGVIWELAAKQGQFVQKGTTIGQVLDCKRRWVDVNVDEDALRSIHPGTPAKIELFGSTSQTFTGKVALIRSGVGRLQAGQEVAAVANTPNLPRTSQVRVDLDPGSKLGTPDALCYVGYTAKVSFAVK